MWQNLKNQIVTKLRNSNSDKPWQLKLWPNWKTWNCDKTRTLELWQNLTTQIVTKLKPSNFDKTKKKLKLWPNSKPKIVTKLKNSICEKNQKLKFLHNSNYYKTQKLKLWQNSQTQYVLFKTTWHLQNRWDFSGQLFVISRCFFNRALTNY